MSDPDPETDLRPASSPVGRPRRLLIRNALGFSGVSLSGAGYVALLVRAYLIDLDSAGCADGGCSGVVAAVVSTIGTVTAVVGVILIIVGSLPLTAFVVWSALQRGPRRGIMTVYWAVAVTFTLLAALDTLMILAGASDLALLLILLPLASGSLVLTVLANRVRHLPRPDWAESTQALREMLGTVVLVTPFLFPPLFADSGLASMVTDMQGVVFAFVGVGVWILVAGPAWTTQVQVELRTGVRAASPARRLIFGSPLLTYLLAVGTMLTLTNFTVQTALYDVTDIELLVAITVVLAGAGAACAFVSARCAGLPEPSWAAVTEVGRQVLVVQALAGTYLHWSAIAQQLDPDRAATLGMVVDPAISFILGGVALLLIGRGVTAYRAGVAELAAHRG